jgi:hypothetical protein
MSSSAFGVLLMIRHVLLAFVVAIIPLGTFSAYASDPQPITWSDLAPDNTFPDPFKKLSQNQLADLSFVVRIHHLLAAERVAADGPEVKEAAKIERSLKKAGIDIGWLVAQRRRVGQMREIQAKAVQQNVIGTRVKLSGYVVPVKKSDGVVTEFMLVPSVASCSSSNPTPPPPNQAIFVQLEDGFARLGRVTAARIIGRIEAKEIVRTIPSIRGSTVVTSAYVITPENITFYSTTKNGQTTPLEKYSRKLDTATFRQIQARSASE